MPLDAQERLFLLTLEAERQAEAEDWNALAETLAARDLCLAPATPEITEASNRVIACLQAKMIPLRQEMRLLSKAEHVARQRTQDSSSTLTIEG